MNTDRIFNAIVLNEPYAGKVKERIKTIETRMKRSIPVGDIVICCDGLKSKHSKNAGRALCIVHVDGNRPMTEDDEEAACIECVPKRIAFPLSNWRYFSYDFKFTDYKVGGSYQSIFQVRIPDFVQVLNSEQSVKESDTTTAQSMDEPLLPNKKS